VSGGVFLNYIKKGLLYEGHKVVPFCPRCGTPLSSHEVAQGYKTIREDSIYVAFKVKNKPKEYILAWTTTPWTLPANVALAIGEKIDYVRVKLSDGDTLILGKEKLNLIKGGYEVVETLKGKKLIGLEYEPLYDIKELQNKKSHKIVPADFVTTEEGTGVVHIAVMYGEDDYRIGKKLGLPSIHTVGQDGKFLPIVPKFSGKFVKSAEKDIIQDLKEKHLLFKVEKIQHSYPFCWRCDTPLLYYGIDSWFISASKVRKKMLELNKKINWFPKHIQDGRFGKWLEGAKDWALSRFKLWGTPLPIWRCASCKKEKIIGSIEELKKNSLRKITGKIDLHKPWIDDIKFKCSCGEKMERVPDVIDCWYDSGSASFAQFHYPFENKKEFQKRFPYDFIAEAIDQTRGWFYTLHVISTILFNKPAYKNVICAGHIVDEKGEKMSKTKGNVIVPREIIDKAGVDSIRLQFCTTDVGNFKRFSFELMRESVLPFLTVLYNTNKYYNQLEEKPVKEKNIEDKWILSRLNSTIKNVTENLDKYSLDIAFQSINKFVTDDLSRGYIRITRERSDTKKIIEDCLEKVSLLLAPFAPYISEYLYGNFSKDSVHLSKWPKVDKKKIDKNLEEKFQSLLWLIEKGFSERDKVKIGLKWPLSKAKISYYVKLEKDFEKIFKSQLNVKKIDWKKAHEKDWNIELDTKLTPKLEEEGYSREMSRQIQAFRKKLGLQKNQKVNVFIITDDKFKKILENQKEFIKNRVNAKILKVVTTTKERFKNETDFKIKDMRGGIAIVQ